MSHQEIILHKSQGSRTLTPFPCLRTEYALVFFQAMVNQLKVFLYIYVHVPLSQAYMQKTCDVAGKAILAKINLRKKCVNRDKM